MRTFYSALLLVFLSSACKPKSDIPPAMDSGAPASALNRDWTLVQLGDNANPLGNGGRPVTLRLDTTEQRAWGNAGCNRYSGPYHLAGDSLAFGPAISTKMACEQGMDVEIAFLSMLNDVRTYQATDSSLTLMGPAGELARFR